jgi:catechol 2,3-dioxygenase-like lactoylglutathione lyase family enzyme
MKIKRLTLLTKDLKGQKDFYSKTLGFTVVEVDEDSFAVQVGWSILTFISNQTEHFYHFCFLVPSNKLNESLIWMQKRTEIVEVEKGEYIVHFKTWNAHSFYFYDASGNIAEFIVRHDLENGTNTPFDINQVICVNEISFAATFGGGLGTNDPKAINSKLEQEIGSKFWKGDLERFATNGSLEGIFLLPNYEIKDVWFPTVMKIKPEPIQASIENDGTGFIVFYQENELIIKSLD